MFASIQTLFKNVAATIGVPSLPLDENEAATLAVGDSATAILIGEAEDTLLVMAPVGALPLDIDYASTVWLLQRGFHDSPIAPFRVSCDSAGTVVIWGRIPVEGMEAADLMKLLSALGDEVDTIRAEVGIAVDEDETEEEDAAA
jgi:hypothetical protein